MRTEWRGGTPRTTAMIQDIVGRRLDEEKQRNSRYLAAVRAAATSFGTAAGYARTAQARTPARTSMYGSMVGAPSSGSGYNYAGEDYHSQQARLIREANRKRAINSAL
jgi:hypothetical protein